MLEYIILTASVDEEFDRLVQDVKSGKVKEISASTRVIPGSGLEPPVSMPQKPDNREYIEALSTDQKSIFCFYESVIENSEASELVNAVKNGKIKPSSTDKEGQTPLHIAVEAGFSGQTITDLVNLGCDINAQTVDGTTPLHAAMLNENEEMFKQLADLGANPDIEDESGDTVREQCNKRYTKFRKYLN